MKIALVGDIHGNPKSVSSNSWAEGKDFGKDDLVIFLGDFGLFWNNPTDKEEKYWLDWLGDKEYQVAFLDGNHENFDIINAFPEDLRWDGKVGVCETSNGPIWHLKRGEVYRFDPLSSDKTFVMGGALSIDKHLRQEGRTWWPQEQHSPADETNALDNLDNCNWKVKNVLSHTCPDSVLPAFIDYAYGGKMRDPAARFLEYIANKLEFQRWDFGHMHNARTFVDGSYDFYKCHWGKPYIEDDSIAPAAIAEKRADDIAKAEEVARAAEARAAEAMLRKE